MGVWKCLGEEGIAMMWNVVRPESQSTEDTDLDLFVVNCVESEP